MRPNVQVLELSLGDHIVILGCGSVLYIRMLCILKGMQRIPLKWWRRRRRRRREKRTGFRYAAANGTVAILAQGTSWAVAVTQAFLLPGSILHKRALRNNVRQGKLRRKAEQGRALARTSSTVCFELACLLVHTMATC